MALNLPMMVPVFLLYIHRSDFKPFTFAFFFLIVVAYELVLINLYFIFDFSMMDKNVVYREGLRLLNSLGVLCCMHCRMSSSFTKI